MRSAHDRKLRPMSTDLDDAGERGRRAERRTSARFVLTAEITLWRPGKPKYCAQVEDLSLEGCKTTFVDRPRANERALVKFERLEALSSTIQLVSGDTAGVKFDHPLHPAVFDLLLARTRPPRI